MKKPQLRKYTPAPKWYVRKRLGADASIVLIYLIEIDGLYDGEWVKCSFNGMVNATGISKMTVMKCIDRLIEERFIERRLGEWKGNSIYEYHIRYEVINAVEKPAKKSTSDNETCSNSDTCQNIEGGLKIDRSVAEGGGLNLDPLLKDQKTSGGYTIGPEYLPNYGSRAPEEIFCIQNDDIVNDSVNSESPSTGEKRKIKKEKKETESRNRVSDKNDTSDNNSGLPHGEPDKNDNDMIDYENQPEWLEHQSGYIDGPVTTVRPMNDCVNELLNTIEACIAKVKSATDIENVRVQRRKVDEAFNVFRQSSCGRSASERQIAFIETKLNNFTRIAAGKERLYGGAVQMCKDELSQQMRQDGYEPHEVKAFVSHQTNSRQPYKVAGAENGENRLSEITIKTLKAKFGWQPGTGNAPLASSEAHQRTNAPSDDKLFHRSNLKPS